MKSILFVGSVMLLLCLHSHAQGKFSGGSGSGYASAAGSSIPLPVSLLFFNVQLNSSDQVAIDWETATETNSDYFIVERSSDGRIFHTIAILPAAGSSNIPIKYHHLDLEALQPGVYYYRLIQLDFNGDQESWPPKALQVSQTSQLEIYPNPSHGMIMVRTLSNQVVSYDVYDILGNVKMTFTTAGNYSKVDLSHLKSGTYWIRPSNPSISASTPIIIFPK